VRDRGLGRHSHSDECFAELATVWLENLDLEARIAPSTPDLYERDMRTLELPAFEHLALREITLSRVDRFRKQQASLSYIRAKHSKAVLGLALGLAVRYDAIPWIPVPRRHGCGGRSRCRPR
jgi:hypothetical protein